MCMDGTYLPKTGKLKKVLIFSLILNLFLLTVGLGLHFWWRKRFPPGQSGAALGARCSRLDSGVTLPTDSLCVTCDELGEQVQASDTLYESIIKSKCGRKMCCYRDDALTRLLSQDLMSDPKAPDDKFSWWYNRPNAAHLFLDQSVSPPRWSSNSVPGISFSNLQIRNNRISIYSAGIYYVYAAFTVDFRKFGSDIPQMYHNITSQHPLLKRTGPELHFMNKYGGFVDSKQTQHTSFLCGILNLRRRVEIATQISLHSFVNHSIFSNYFGLFKIQ